MATTAHAQDIQRVAEDPRVHSQSGPRQRGMLADQLKAAPEFEDIVRVGASGRTQADPDQG
ncbi:MAG: hypothetical protein P4L39_10895 [Humidesulfovibrio sp.]|nr:hypothetical protein [Humidesulfovibrio sp.]